jgi:AhpD family alkylhydroperoxidase
MEGFMNFRLILVGALLLCAQNCLAETPRASMKNPTALGATDTEYQATLQDIKATLGSVPSFFKGFPTNGLPGAWQAMKNFQMNPNTAIPNQYKELIGLAVSSQIPCHYCTFFHTEGAKLNGASPDQIKEAVAIAAIERQWSTVLDGTQQDEGAFKKEVDKFIKKAEKEMAQSKGATPAWMTETNFNTPEEAYRDIEASLGLVPQFMKNYPSQGIAGAWKEMKTVLFNPNTAIPSKYKDLISLSVSAQIPCKYCIYYDTRAAKLDGATDNEINEAVAMASSSRHWSTVLNGLQTDNATFRKEMAQVYSNAKKSTTAKATETTHTPGTTTPTWH